MIEDYPHVNIEVEDASSQDVFQTDFMPISRQVYLLKAQKGEIFEPKWCPTYASAVKEFGAGTFDVTDKTYSSPASYLATEVFRNNGAFICRMAPYGPTIEEAKAAKCSFGILEVLYHEVSDFGPDKDEAGIDMHWRMRTVLQGDESLQTLDELKPYTYIEPISAIEWNVLPMVAFKSSSPGLHGDNTGFQFYYEAKDNDAGFVEDYLKSVVLSFAPVEKPAGTSNLVPIRDMYSNPNVNFVMKPDVFNQTTQRFISAKNVIDDYYSGNYALPYECFFYGENYKTLGDAVVAVEYPAPIPPAVVKSGYLINLLSLKDLTSESYTHVRFVELENVASENMLYGVSHKLGAGFDGDISDTSIEELIISWLHLDLNPKITDVPRYPFTHFTDPGYHFETKKAMIDFQDIREEIKTIISTQQVTEAVINDVPAKNTPNTNAEDESIGEALRSYALLKRESLVKGTACCRTTIFMQCGKPVDKTYDKYLPATYWAAKKRAEYQNRDFMNKEPKGLPNAEIDVFKWENWVPHAKDTKRRSWSAGLNYFQFYDMKRLHYPSIRTVYPLATSVLVDDTFTDAIIYTKYVIRSVWAQYVGLDVDVDTLYGLVEKTLSNKLNSLYNGRYTFNVKAWRTATEKALGFVHHITVDLYATIPARVFEVDVVCQRSPEVSTD